MTQINGPAIQLDPLDVERFLAKTQWSGLPMNKSLISSFKRCRLQWAHEVILGTPGDNQGPELELGRACHQVVKERLSLYAPIAEEQVPWRLANLGVATPRLAEAIEWVGRAVELAHDRGGEVVDVELPVALRLGGMLVKGRLDLVISGGRMGATEVLDWTFGRRGRLSTSEEMSRDLGTAIYRSLLAEARPELTRQVIITDVHVPGCREVSAELSWDQVVRAWQEIATIRDEMLQILRKGAVPASPGRACDFCPFRTWCPAAELEAA